MELVWWLGSSAFISLFVIVTCWWFALRWLLNAPINLLHRLLEPLPPLTTTRQKLRRLGANIGGGILVVAGLIMWVTPGPGTLTIVVGLSMMQWPHKRRTMRRFLAQPWVLEGLNRLRRWYQRPEFLAVNNDE